MYVREHELANTHPIKLKGEKDAEKAVERAIKADTKRAKALRAKAEKLIEEASEMENAISDSRYYNHRKNKYKTLREEIEEKAYWQAREAIGTLPRDDKGEYIDPAPRWQVSYNGEDLGIFQEEERTDVLAKVCPRDDPRSWGDFEVVRLPD